MNKILLEVIGLSYSHSQSGAYALILGEKSSKRRLPVIIGSSEAMSIAIATDELKNRRPLTHDLFKSFASAYDINIYEVIINRFKEGIFYSELHTIKDGEEMVIDARTSDAIALALRFKCPIYTYPQIMEEAGIIIDDIDLTDDNDDENLDINKNSDNEYEDYRLKDLQSMLQEAIDNEDYEAASKIRDEIKKRGNKKI